MHYGHVSDCTYIHHYENTKYSFCSQLGRGKGVRMVATCFYARIMPVGLSLIVSRYGSFKCILTVFAVPYMKVISLTFPKRWQCLSDRLTICQKGTIIIYQYELPKIWGTPNELKCNSRAELDVRHILGFVMKAPLLQRVVEQKEVSFNGHVQRKQQEKISYHAC